MHFPEETWHRIGSVPRFLKNIVLLDSPHKLTSAIPPIHYNAVILRVSVLKPRSVCRLATTSPYFKRKAYHATSFGRTVDLTELYIADEVFVCGTSAGVAPVHEIDGRAVAERATGPVTLMLRKRHLAALTGDEVHGWVTTL